MTRSPRADGRPRRRLEWHDVRFVTLVLALALAVVGLRPVSAQAQSGHGKSVSACRLSSWGERDAKHTVQLPGGEEKSAIRLGCAGDAPQAFAELAQKPEDFMVAMAAEGQIRPEQLDAEIQNIRQWQDAGWKLSDIFKSRMETYKLGMHPVSMDGIEFDGRVEAVDGNVVVVIPAAEVVAQANWWQKAIATSVSITAGLLATALCLAPFAVGAPLAGPVCGAVGGFTVGMVGELLNAVFDERSFSDVEVWKEALAVALVEAAFGAAGGALMKWAEFNMNPLFVNLHQAIKDLAGRIGNTLGTGFAEAVGTAAGHLVVIGENLYAKMVEVAARIGVSGAPTRLRVLPLGDEITSGESSSTDAGYRGDLWNGLSAGGHTVDFVGTRQSGRLPDADHEGVPDLTIPDISARADVAVRQFQPNVVTVHAGTHDLEHGADPADAAARLGTMVSHILTDAPGVTVLVSTLVPSKDAALQARIDAFNQRVVDLAQRRSLDGDKVRAVSMASVTTADLVDTLHPDDGGYRKMAGVFRSAIDQSIISGMITDATVPHDVADADDASLSAAAGFLADVQDRYPFSLVEKGTGLPITPLSPLALLFPPLALAQLLLSGQAVKLGVVQSYTGGHFGPGGSFGPTGYQSSFTYDNAVVIASLLKGRHRDVDRARLLGDSLLYAQAHDPVNDGRIRASYLPEPFVTTLGRDYPVGTPYIGGWSVYTGNMAWAGMAFCHLYRATGDHKYLDGALRAAEWIQTNSADSRGAGGYTGGFADTSAREDGSGMVERTWKATEHNIDVGAFFTMLAQLTHDQKWKDRSDNAFGFVRTMLSADGNHLWTGTGLDGVTVNEDAVPEDVQTWAYLATLDPVFSRTVDWAAGRMAATDGGFSGVSFSAVDTSGVWFEGTAHLLAAYHARGAAGDAEKAAVLTDTLRRAQDSAPNADGAGIVAASHDGLDTGQGDRYYASLHTGATAWYLLAGQGANPFRL